MTTGAASMTAMTMQVDETAEAEAAAMMVTTTISATSPATTSKWHSSPSDYSLGCSIAEDLL